MAKWRNQILSTGLCFFFSNINFRYFQKMICVNRECANEMDVMFFLWNKGILRNLINRVKTIHWLN